MASTRPVPNPATLGYSTWAQTPYSSIRRSRAPASHVAGSTRSRLGGCSGGYWCQPAWAAEAPGDTRVSPKYHASSCLASSHFTWGTRSPHLVTEMRDVHRSYGSITWVSV